jgi:hypothetical protein
MHDMGQVVSAAVQEARFVTLTDLSKSAGEVIDAVATDGVPTIVLRRGEFAAIIQKLDPEAIKALLVERLPDLITAREDADTALKNSQTTSTEKLAADLGIDLGGPPD